jgi:hypothetical protein
MIQFKDLKKDDYLLYNYKNREIYIIHIVDFICRFHSDKGVRTYEIDGYSIHGGNQEYNEGQWNCQRGEYAKKITVAEVKRYKIKFVFWKTGDPI